jgi:hypothetical protein
MPRTRSGIGQLVAVLDGWMSQHPGTQALRNRIDWPAVGGP